MDHNVTVTLLCITFCLLCISTSECVLAQTFTWLKTMKNTWKSSKKYFFLMNLRRSRKWPPNAGWHPKGVVNARGFGLNSIIFVCEQDKKWLKKKVNFLLLFHELFMSISYTWREWYFLMIFIIFNHVNKCTSMRLLVEIHNNCQFLFQAGSPFWMVLFIFCATSRVPFQVFCCA